MDRKALIWIIALAGIAMMGLVAIQVYWIRNGLTIREANFRLAVDHAVRQAIYQMEWQEAGLYLKTDPAADHHALVLEVMDSLRRTLDQHLRSQPRIGSTNQSDQQWQGSEVGDNSRQLVIDPEAVPELPAPDTARHKQDLYHRFDSLHLRHKKQILMDKLLDEIILQGSMPAIEERLSAGSIDTLLREGLAARGIHMDFEFGVYNPSHNAFVIQKPGANPELLLRKGMVFPLFPSEHRAIPDYLLIRFPGERHTLLFQLWGMTGISILFLVIIILTFAYSINVVLRQRKFAEMKNDFINNMTHEFKTPISTVALACEALTDSDIQKSESLYNSYISIISEENKRLGVMAEKILQTAIIEKGQVRLKQEKFDLHHVIEDVIRNIRIQVEIKDGTIAMALHAGNSQVVADRVHVSNVIYNLLDNANKYTPRKPEIRITTENNEQGIWVKVADNGIGISKAHQRKVFDKLYRVPTGDVHDFKGFGLGLSYVKAIVEQHGGVVGLESELNKGSEFRFFLPQHLEQQG